MRRFLAASACVLAAGLCGCLAGPDYQRPTAPTPIAFKEATGWTPSRPADAADKGAWWSVFHDPVLDGLERRAAVSNQTIKQAEAAYRYARQVVAAARAGLFPVLGASAGAARARTAGGEGTAVEASSYSATLDASWTPDLWGRIRRTIESDRALAEVGAADLANARLSIQAGLADAYFQLRGLDAQIGVLQAAVDADRRFLATTRRQLAEGYTPGSAVLAAEVQLDQAESALAADRPTRANLEHAVALLLGAAPAELTIAPAPLAAEAPVAPAGLPSILLQRRPDIAAAERQVASANALIGVATAAYYPDLTLTSQVGGSGGTLGRLFSASGALWSFGAEAAEMLVDFGQRRAQVRAARAVFDQDVAAYRQTVLNAFAGVEDDLATLHGLQDQRSSLTRAEQTSGRQAALAASEYREGTVGYLAVLAAETDRLQASLAVAANQQQRLQASVHLIEDLGGGW